MAESKHLNYSSVKPLGVPSKIKIAKFIPQSSYGNIASNDTIRFQINTPGFWDPYSAYFNIEVEATGLSTTTGFSQIDHSAHSLISELIIYSKGTEIERIQEYDSIAAILGDIHLSPEQRASRSHEGYGYSYRDKSKWTERDQTAIPYFTTGTFTGTVYGQAGPNPLHRRHPNTYDTNDVTFLTDTVTSGTFLNAQTFGNTGVKAKINGAKLAYASGWTLFTKSLIGLNRADDNMLLYEEKGIYEPQPLTFDKGFTRLDSVELGGGCNEQRFTAKTIVTPSGGQLSAAKQILKCQFSIPILSGLLGVLMPKESYKYIPMAALEDLIIEIRLSKYALFSSGFAEDEWGTQTTNFNTDNPFMKTGSTQLSREFKITNFELMADIIMFDKEIENAVIAQLNTEEGIILHSSSWYLGPQFLQANTQAVTGTWQINLGFESLKSVVFYFLSEDYRTKNYCRKQYRLSRNLTWMQLKIGIDYYPSLPIEGHSGCIANTEGYGDNSEFLINMRQAIDTRQMAKGSSRAGRRGIFRVGRR